MDSSTRAAVQRYQDEFTGYFNNSGATLSPNAFSNFKKQQWNDMTAKNGGKPSSFTPLMEQVEGGLRHPGSCETQRGAPKSGAPRSRPSCRMLLRRQPLHHPREGDGLAYVV